jgi:putative MATE family efflux protein
MVMEMSMESLFSVVDIFWVSRLGANAIATVGLTESLLSLIYAVAMGLSMASTALVSRRIGEKDPDGAARTAVQALVAGLGAAILIGGVGVFLAPTLLTAMGASEAVLAEGTTYAQIMLGGNASIMLLFLANAVFRGAGDAAAAMRSLWLANIANMLLAPCFIFGLGPIPALGVTGAAVATNIGRTLGVVYQLYLMFRGTAHLKIRAEHFSLDPAVLGRLLRVSSSGVLQMLIETASWVGLVRIVSTFGSAAVAGYTIAIRVIIFALLPSWGLANAAATLVGQNLGAKQPERAEQSVWLSARYNLLFLGSLGVLLGIFAPQIVAFFTIDPEVTPYAIDCLRIVALGFLFYAYGMVAVQAFNGAGDTRTPTVINFVCFWLVKLPVAWLLAIPLGMGTRGIFIAVTVAYSAQALIGVLQFRRGRWKTNVV